MTLPSWPEVLLGPSGASLSLRRRTHSIEAILFPEGCSFRLHRRAQKTARNASRTPGSLEETLRGLEGVIAAHVAAGNGSVTAVHVVASMRRDVQAIERDVHRALTARLGTPLEVGRVHVVCLLDPPA